MIDLEHTAQIWCVYGNLGGGKTLTSVAVAVNAMQQGYFICTNIRLNVDLVRSVCPFVDRFYMCIDVRKEEYDVEGRLISSSDFNPFTIPSGSPRGSGGNKRVLVILDECAEWFDQYTRGTDAVIRRVMSWLRHSSKRGQDVLFIVQRLEYLQKSFRILCSRFIRVEDLRTFRIPKIRIPLPFMGNFVFAQVLDKAGNVISPPSLISKTYYGRFYDTAQDLSSHGNSYEYELPTTDFKPPFLLLLFWLVSLFSLFFVL